MAIKIENLEYVYMPGSPFEKKALDNINLEIKKGETVITTKGEKGKYYANLTLSQLDECVSVRGYGIQAIVGIIEANAVHDRAELVIGSKSRTFGEDTLQGIKRNGPLCSILHLR